MSNNSQQNKQQIPVTPGTFEIEKGRPHLIGTKCSKCGAAFFPPRCVCTYCLTDEGVEKARLGNTGKLYTFTMIYVSSREFNPPYPFGYVILEPENIRIPTLITGVEKLEVLKTGMKMEMVIEKLRDDDKGNELITYKFRPVVDI